MKKTRKTAADKLKTSIVDELKGLPSEDSPDQSTVVASAEAEKTAVLSTEPPESQDIGYESDVSGAEAPAEKTVLSPRSAAPIDDSLSIKTSFGAQQVPEYDLNTPNNSFAYAETLKHAQARILELEKENEKLRRDNEVLGSANDLTNQKIEELQTKIQKLDHIKSQLKEQNENELKIFRDGLHAKDHEIQKWKSKVEEFEARFASDLKRIRIKERELENRLELAKSEKVALVRSKDDIILDLKRQISEFESEIEAYKSRIVELNEKLDGNQEQFSRTIRALRVALTNLEASENTGTITLAPLKKAD